MDGYRDGKDFDWMLVAIYVRMACLGVDINCPWETTVFVGLLNHDQDRYDMLGDAAPPPTSTGRKQGFDNGGHFASSTGA